MPGRCAHGVRNKNQLQVLDLILDPSTLTQWIGEWPDACVRSNTFAFITDKWRKTNLLE